LKTRLRLVALVVIAPLGLAACEAILGLHDHVLADAGEISDASAEASDATTCDGDFCACHPHAFCDDFDPYTSVTDLQPHWQVPGFSSSTIQLGGSLSLDDGTNVLPPSPPNALLATVFLPNELQGAGFVMSQLDASVPNVVGIHANVRFRAVTIDPADGAPPLYDSGIALFGAVLAVVNFTTKNGVGIALSEQGAYLGYALDVLALGALAQGKQFMQFNPASLGQYTDLDLIVAKRSSKSLPTVDCTPGPVLTNIDGGAPDAAVPADPVVVVVQTSLTAPACEVLSADLAEPDWLASPLFFVGSVVKGQGQFSVDFDDFTLDFVTE
jgi:hypothetical protein